MTATSSTTFSSRSAVTIPSPSPRAPPVTIAYFIGDPLRGPAIRGDQTTFLIEGDPTRHAWSQQANYPRAMTWPPGWSGANARQWFPVGPDSQRSKEGRGARAHRVTATTRATRLLDDDPGTSSDIRATARRTPT